MSENTKSKMTEKKEERKRLEQQIRFIIEADKVKSVFRQTYLADRKPERKRCGTFMASGIVCDTFERAYGRAC